jgi:hypothetical protein
MQKLKSALVTAICLAGALGAAIPATAAVEPTALSGNSALGTGSVVPAANPDCQNNDGFQTIVKTAPVTAINGVRVGTVELCREGSLYFGFVIFNQAMTASQYAQAYLDRYDNGVLVGTVSCDDGGGNGQVLPGQRRCWTPNLNGAAVRYTFVASAYQFSSHTGDLLSSGGTVRAR